MGRYEIFATTADAGIRFQGRDFAELYGNALRGLNLLLFGRNSRPPAGGGSRRFRFRGDGPENVLVNLLSEALFLVYHEGKRVAASEFRHAGRNSVDARLLLAPLTRAPAMEVKSATYHDLRVEQRGGILSAAVVLDI
ncbi:MAG: archease [Candidatus Aminicenantes bacterium]|nr:archease [Candidatus Aminicenantes bacterium]